MKTAGSFLMYRIEITTPTPHETILKEYNAETWTEASGIIKDIQNLDFDNIDINLYKRKAEKEIIYPIEDGDDIYNFIDNFTNVKQRGSLFDNIPKKKNKKLLKTAATAAGMIAAFPVMVTTELIKKS